MATVKLLFLCAVLLVCAVAVAPTPTPAAAQYSYSNTTDADFPCRIRLNGTMAWDFTYNTTKNIIKNVTEVVNGTAKVLDDSSSCIHRESAELVLTWSGTKNETRLLTFKFTAGNEKTHMNWQLENVTLAFNITPEVFPDYRSEYSTDAMLYSDGFIDDTNSDVEYQRSYMCDSLRKVDFNDMTNISLNVSLNITNFRIQAFDFKEPNSTKNAFGNARVCPTDSKGKTIVPIAVGIALGVLVIAVIVAFIISKIVNRKKSGYEALN